MGLGPIPNLSPYCRTPHSYKPCYTPEKVSGKVNKIVRDVLRFRVRARYTV